MQVSYGWGWRWHLVILLILHWPERVCVCVCVCVHAWWGEVAESFSKGPVYGRSEAWRLMTQSPRPSFPPSMQIRCQLINQNIWETRAGGPPSRLSQKASLNSQAWSELYGFLASLWILSLLSHGCTEFFPHMQVALIKSEKSDSIFIAEGEGSEKEREGATSSSELDTLRDINPQNNIVIYSELQQRNWGSYRPATHFADEKTEAWRQSSCVLVKGASPWSPMTLNFLPSSSSLFWGFPSVGVSAHVHV